jgi:cell volume regulation protein A
MAIFLTIGFIEFVLGRVTSPIDLIGLLASQMILGGLMGWVMGLVATWVVNRIDLDAAGLYPVLVSTFCLLTFGLAVQLGGSGFLAAYIAGVVIGNQKLVMKRGILLYHNAIAWLCQIVMFVLLGLLSFPSRLVQVSWQGLLIALVLCFVARPVAVCLCLWPFRFNWREYLFVSWVGLKGAVPITLAIFPLTYGTPQADLVFDVVFFVVTLSALFQGGTLTQVAGWLGLSIPPQPAPPVTLEISSLKHVDGAVLDYTVSESSRAAGRLVRDLALPDGVVIALVVRGGHLIPPQGKTRVEAGDHVMLVVRPGTEPLVSQIFGQSDEARGAIPPAYEFPLRASVTLGTLQELYGIHLPAPSAMTLGEALRRDFGATDPGLGDEARYGPIRLRVLSLTPGGAIEMVGMSIQTEDTTQTAAPEGPSAGSVAAV